MEQETKIPILEIDVRIRFRGALYEIRPMRALKWLAALVVVGIRVYYQLSRGG